MTFIVPIHMEQRNAVQVELEQVSIEPLSERRKLSLWNKRV